MTSTSIYSAAILVTQSKICNKCNIEKYTIEFYKNMTSKDGLKSICKLCEKNDRKLHRQINIERIKEYIQKNKERDNIKCKEYNRKNKGSHNARGAKYRATKLKATPKWVELDLIKQLYKDCELMSEMTGIKHHVDHIVPLQSDIVRGLHCIANLQILTEFENLSKSNLYWPDMP